MQIVLASFILPCSAIAVLAGMLWGVEIGILYSLLATICASSWTFIVGRYISRKWDPSKYIFSWYKGTIALVNSHNWKASMIAHANPLFPGSSLGYIFGLSKVSYYHFLIGVIFGTLPLQIVIVLFGHFSNSIVKPESSFILLPLFILVIIMLILYRKLVPNLLNSIK